jgi:NCS1 family nucleobase:cation symporter-1
LELDSVKNLTHTAPSGHASRELVETRAFLPIPGELRYGSPWQQFVFWFAFNSNVISILTGVLAPEIGLNMAWSIIAILAGNLFGAVFVALHGAQGPRLGLPQVVQSRAQFGYYGVAFLFLALFVLEFGFLATSQVITAGALHGVVPAISLPAGIVLVTVPSVLIAVLGYRWIHWWQAVTLPFFLIALVAFTVMMLISHPLRHGAFALSARPSFASFLVVVSIMAVYQLAVAPFVSDYSRYLPENTGIRTSMGLTYAGLVLAPIWLEIVGAWLATLYPGRALADAARAIGGRWILVVIALGLIGVVATNMYSGMLALAGLSGLGTRRRNGALVRTAGILITTAVGVGVALASYRSFVDSFENFLLVLLFVFVPWTSINLTDYYFVRRGVYDVPSILEPDGVYGRFNWNGAIAYAAGMVAQWLFVSQTLLTGPLVHLMGGADISWIVGLVVPGSVYLLLCRLRDRPHGVRRDFGPAVPVVPE